MKKILYLTLNRKWFDKIATGEKKIEYRDIKPYWIKRVEHKNYDEVYFRNGYQKNSPFMRVKYEGYKKTNRYELKLGIILEIKY